MIERPRKKIGFTLVEILIVVAIFLLIALALSQFIRDIFWQNYVVSQGLVADGEAKLTLSRMINELRRTESAANGAYPIEVAGSSTLIFFSDLDDDGLRERLRYWLENGDLKRGLIEPVGPPYVYNPATETVSTPLKNLANAGGLVFTYYDNNYDGTASSTPLPAPVEIGDIRLIKIEFSVDADTEQAPIALYLTGQVMLRNLKDNL